MSDKKQILLAFFIPLILAIGLLFLRIFVFYDPSLEFRAKAQSISFCEFCAIPLEYEILNLLIVAIFILALILPSFVMMRTYQGRRNKLESPSIIE